MASQAEQKEYEFERTLVSLQTQYYGRGQLVTILYVIRCMVDIVLSWDNMHEELPQLRENEKWKNREDVLMLDNNDEKRKQVSY